MKDFLARLIKKEADAQRAELPSGHHERFLAKLKAEKDLKRPADYQWWWVAAGIAALIVFALAFPGSDTNNSEETPQTSAVSFATLRFQQETDAIINRRLQNLNLDAPSLNELKQRLADLENEHKRLTALAETYTGNSQIDQALRLNSKLRLKLLDQVAVFERYSIQHQSPKTNPQ